MIGDKTVVLYFLLSVNVNLICSQSDDDPKLFNDLTGDLENWMSKLPKRLKAVPIKDIAIPGTHDSFTSGISRKSHISPDNKDIPKILGYLPSALVIASWAKCQDLDVTGQLKAGIRFFDARFCRNSENGHLYFCHGMYSSEITGVLNDMASFLSSHPKEVVIMDCQHFYEFHEQIHYTLIKQILDTFGDKLVPYEKRMDLITLDYLNSKNQQIIVVYRYYIGRNEKKLWPQESLRSKWHNTMDPKKLFIGLDSGIRNRAENTAHVSQCILTPSVQDIAKNVLSSLRQKAAVEFQSKRIAWVSRQTPGRNGVNIIINDFIDLSNNLFSRTVINLNRKLADTEYENGVNERVTWFQRKETGFTFTWVQ